MSKDKNTTENIMAPAMGRALSAIAQRRTSPMVSKTTCVDPDKASEGLSAAASCTHSPACTM